MALHSSFEQTHNKSPLQNYALCAASLDEMSFVVFEKSKL